MMEESSQNSFPVLTSPIINSGTNPLGKVVLLKEGTWKHHIEVGHTEIDQETMMKNVSSPTYISTYTSNTELDSKIRYNYYSLTNHNGNIYCLKTVTESIDDLHEDIVTSHIMKKIKTEGEIIYGHE